MPTTPTLPARSAKLALAAALSASLIACGQAPPRPQAQAAPTPAALVLSWTQRREAQPEAQPLVPAVLAVPAGNALFKSLIGVGDQIYTCAASGGAYAWTFVAPRADLYNFGFRKVGVHFAGPTWQDSADGSAVVGRLVRNVPAPFSLNGRPAVAWLLLAARSTTFAGDGMAGAFTPTTFVRRLFTVGGVAPTSGCDAGTAGQNLGVPYAALYEFYRARGP